MHLSHAIVACARGWIGTRFHHQGRLKKTAAHKGGVDCLGLLAGVARELNLLDDKGAELAAADETNYPHYPDCTRLRRRLGGLLREIPESELRPGDVILLEIDRQPQHLAIVSDCGNGLGLIHAYAPAKAVVEHTLDAGWRARIAAAFRVRQNHSN